MFFVDIAERLQWYSSIGLFTCSSIIINELGHRLILMKPKRLELTKLWIFVVFLNLEDEINVYCFLKNKKTSTTIENNYTQIKR